MHDVWRAALLHIKVSGRHAAQTWQPCPNNAINVWVVGAKVQVCTEPEGLKVLLPDT